MIGEERSEREEQDMFVVAVGISEWEYQRGIVYRRREND